MGVDTNIQIYSRFNKQGEEIEVIREDTLDDGKGFIRTNQTTGEVRHYGKESTN